MPRTQQIHLLGLRTCLRLWLILPERVTSVHTHKGNVAKLRSVVVVSVIASWLRTRIKSQRSFWLLASSFLFFFSSFVTFLSFVSFHFFFLFLFGAMLNVCVLVFHSKVAVT